MSEAINAQTIANLAVAGMAQHVAGENGTPFVILPPGHSIHDLEELLPAPERIRVTTRFISLESFMRYVNEFKQEGTTVYISPDGSAKGIIDGPSKGAPRWGQHIAHFTPTYSDRWRTWDALHKRAQGQKQFAEFVEDNNADFVAPPGADMLDIAQTLQAEQSAVFESGIRTDSGNVSLSYKKTTTAKAGQRGDLQIPSMFAIRLPILEGEPARTIEMRLRYDLTEGKLTLTYEILRRTALLEEVRRSIYASIANENDLEPFLVA